MSSTITPLAPEARAAYSVFTIFPRRRYTADMLLQQLIPMQAHAAARAEHTRVWKDAAQQLTEAIDMVGKAVDAPLMFGRPVRRAACAITGDAIVAFEKAHTRFLPHDDHGRYTPEPGTEYPFSVSDIGRAAVQLLGPTWHAESLPWGVGAYIEEHGARQGYMLAVDGDGDLYLCDDARDGNRTYMTDASAADGLDTLATRVADLVLSRHTTTD
ncbi:hypothetical protein U9R90_26970 [Streptomyces sp. E11-3]|uniref:hypothetical protein n=1 Tax=Streptomyces sp. E11-3 TaxID=3110112 RepID=UPI00397EE726